MVERRTNRRSIPLTEKLSLFFLIAGMLSVLVVGLFAFYSARNAMVNRTFDQLTSVRIEKQKRVEKYFEDCKLGLQLLANELLIEEVNSTKPIPILINQSRINNLFSSVYIVSNNRVYELNLVSNKIDINKDSSRLAELLQITKDKILEDGKVHLLQNDTATLGVIHVQQDNADLQTICVIINQQAINDIMLDYNPHNGLGHSGEAYLVNANSVMQSKSRFIDESVGVIKVESKSAKNAQLGQTGIQILDDYREVTVLSSYSPLNMSELAWVILVEIDESEAMIPVYRLRNKIMVSSIIISLVLLIFSFIISRKLTRPLKSLTKQAVAVGKGNYETIAQPDSNDEIGDLTQSFNNMVKELSQKDEALKAEKIKQLRAMIDGQELERQRFSRELHDGLGQSLFGIKMKLENQFSSGADALTVSQNELLNNFDITIEEVRRLSNNLKPAVLEEFGIANALTNLCREIDESSSFSLISSIDDTGMKLAKRSQTYLFRIAQEALNNIQKHARPTNVSLNFFLEGKKVVLSIEDDGCGFDVERARDKRGNGLNNMTERVNLLKGTIHINSVVKRGTIITVELPHNCMV